jgi:hypothetical protein
MLSSSLVKARNSGVAFSRAIVIAFSLACGRGVPNGGMSGDNANSMEGHVAGASMYGSRDGLTVMGKQRNISF